MHGYMFAVAVVAALSVVVGIARLAAWFIDRREEQGTNVIRDAARVAQARAEFLPTPSQIRHQAMGEGRSND